MPSIIQPFGKTVVLVAHPGDTSGPGGSDLAIGLTAEAPHAPAPAPHGMPAADASAASAAPASGPGAPAPALPVVQHPVVQAGLPRLQRSTLVNVGALTAGVLGTGAWVAGATFSAVAAARILNRPTAFDDALEPVGNTGALLASGMALSMTGGSVAALAAHTLIVRSRRAAAARAREAGLEMPQLPPTLPQAPRNLAPITQAVLERAAECDAVPGPQAPAPGSDRNV